jgi:glycosyltransferase involved in cell wall biosynthesis
MSPTVSICIPTYNQTKYLVKVLDSVFEQTFKDYEVIVSDDSSTNEVKELIEHYCLSHLNIRYFHHAPSLGSPENWNFAIKQAKGEYIKIMHHDDWFSTNESLSKYMSALKGCKNPFIFSAAISINKGHKSIHQPKHTLVDGLKEDIFRIIYGNFIGPPSAILFKNDKKKFFNNKLIWLVDIDFYLKALIDEVEVVYIDEPLYTSVIADHNITNDCINNYQLQRYEYLYIFKSLIGNMNYYNRIKNFIKIYLLLNKQKRISILHFINVFYKI